MRKFLSVIVSVLMLISCNMSDAYASFDGLPGYIDLTKMDFTGFSLTIRADYNSGREGGDYDDFIKKSWIRVDPLEEDADLEEIYLLNKNTETIMEFNCTYDPYYLTVTRNGTYIFCGWIDMSYFIDDVEEYSDEIPCYIERIDVTEIKDCTYTDSPTEEVIPKYPYVIEGLSLLSLSGEEFIDIPYDSGFTAEVALNETEERNAEDYIFVAVYGNNGQLLNLDYVKADFIPNTRQSVDFRIPAAGEPIKEIKAFVWDSFGGITPLARSESLRF